MKARTEMIPSKNNELVELVQVILCDGDWDTVMFCYFTSKSASYRIMLRQIRAEFNVVS